MKTLIFIAGIVLLLGNSGVAKQAKDTIAPSKTELVYQKIDQKRQQINQQLHSTDDIYALLIKANKTLNESHELSRVLLVKNDSSTAALTELKSYNKVILKKQDDLEAAVNYNSGFEQQITVADRFINWGVEIAFVSILLFLIIQVATAWRTYVLENKI